MSKQSKTSNFILMALTSLALLAPVSADLYGQRATCTRTHQHQCCLVQTQQVGTYQNAIDPAKPTPNQPFGSSYTCRYRAQLQNAPGTFNNPIKPGEPTPGPVPMSVPAHDCCAGLSSW
ncbi:MAG: hypothetical protein KC800_18245 [Candidatus Eremiobacteraeota bacterium]|nr:hypothetical protein [Candidatus Eremiobacteraeota bacterium]